MMRILIDFVDHLRGDLVIGPRFLLSVTRDFSQLIGKEFDNEFLDMRVAAR